LQAGDQRARKAGHSYPMLNQDVEISKHKRRYAHVVGIRGCICSG
jgi:hypothetical protein